jgi:hypothetical protein
MRRKRAEEEEGGEATTFTFRNEYILSAGSIPTHTHAHTDFDDLHTDCSKAEHPLAAFLSHQFEAHRAPFCLSLSCLNPVIWHAWQCASCIALLFLFITFSLGCL